MQQIHRIGDKADKCNRFGRKTSGQFIIGEKWQQQQSGNRGISK